jgi:hypothetical protein
VIVDQFTGDIERDLLEIPGEGEQRLVCVGHRQPSSRPQVSPW